MLSIALFAHCLCPWYSPVLPDALAMSSILLLHKPFQVLSQFSSPDPAQANLSDLLKGHKFRDFYPAGRLDFDSEGLLILTNDGAMQARIAHPKFKLPKTYWVQVEGEVSDEGLQKLRTGLELKDGYTAPAKAERMSEPPGLWERSPPIRHRINALTSWLSLTITEGKNRQVRRMTAAIGNPTLRLIRTNIGPWALTPLKPGDYRWETVSLPKTRSNRKPNYTSARNKGKAT